MWLLSIKHFNNKTYFLQSTHCHYYSDFTACSWYRRSKEVWIKEQQFSEMKEKCMYCKLSLWSNTQNNSWRVNSTQSTQLHQINKSHKSPFTCTSSSVYFWHHHHWGHRAKIHLHHTACAGQVNSQRTRIVNWFHSFCPLKKKEFNFVPYYVNYVYCAQRYSIHGL